MATARRGQSRVPVSARLAPIGWGRHDWLDADRLSLENDPPRRHRRPI